MNERIQVLEQMLAVALDQRKQAYKLRLNRNFIAVINSQIRDFRSELADLKAGA